MEEEIDKNIKEMIKIAIFIDSYILKGKSMKDVLLENSMKDSISSDLVFPMDFKYSK